MKKGILIVSDIDEQITISNFENSFRDKTDKELAEIYFKQQQVGITGVRMQLLYLKALRIVLLERFGDAPIEYDGELLVL